MPSDITTQVAHYIQASFPILYLVSHEEQRVLKTLQDVRYRLLQDDVEVARRPAAAGPDKPPAPEGPAGPAAGAAQVDIEQLLAKGARPVITWSATRGFHYQRWQLEERGVGLTRAQSDGAYTPPLPWRAVDPPQMLPLAGRDEDYYPPYPSLSSILPPPDGNADQRARGIDLDTAIFVFQDLHLFLPPATTILDPRLIRILRDIADEFRYSERTLVILGPTPLVPFELEKDITIIDYPLPTREEFKDRLQKLEPKLRESKLNPFSPAPAVELEEAKRDDMYVAALGLTLEEFDNVLWKALAVDGRITENAIAALHEEKGQAIRKSGLLEYYAASRIREEEIGGLERLKAWLKKRNPSVANPAAGLPYPKGVLLIGVPGCGKSLAAKAAAGLWGLPLLRLDAGLLYSVQLGSSEANIRQALKLADTLAPVVLWIDEVEKGFPKTSGMNDAGTSTRVLATFLTWMQEKQRPVFVMATANDIRQMPPELTRKGRFDEIFYVGPPHEEERRAIFRIHMKKHQLPDLSEEQLDRLAQQSVDFSGAEIEQLIKNARYENQQISGAEELCQALEREIKNFVPFMRRATVRQELEELNQLSRDVALDASALPSSDAAAASGYSRPSPTRTRG